MKTLFELEKTRPPFETANVLAVNLPVMSYGKLPSRCRSFITRCNAAWSTLPGVEHVSTGFSVPWRDGPGLNISFTFAVQGAKRENGMAGLACAVPFRLTWILRDAWTAAARRPRFSRRRPRGRNAL